MSSSIHRNQYLACWIALIGLTLTPSFAMATITTWGDVVGTHLDTMITYGTDHYGPVHSDMFVSILDVNTLTCPENPDWLDSEAYYEPGRAHRRAMAGANFWYDQLTIKALYDYTEQTGNTKYAQAADAAINAFFDNAIQATSGMPAWGTHTFYNVFTDQPDGDGQHEILTYSAQWDLLYAQRPQETLAIVNGIWNRHMVDTSTGEFNRHDDNAHGCSFAFSGGSFIVAMASMYAETNSLEQLVRANVVANWHWEHRDPVSGLTSDAPSTYPRYDSTHCFTTVTGPYATELLRAYEISGDTGFRDQAVSYLKAYDQYGWDETAGTYFGMLTLDGTPVPTQPQGSGYDAYAPYGHVDMWKTTIYSYEYPLAAAQSYIYGYELTGDADLLQGATRWASAIQQALPVKLGQRWAPELLQAMPELSRVGGSYAEDYGRAIAFFTDMYNATGEKNYLTTAEEVAQDAVDKLYVNGIFKAHAAKPYYETTAGVSLLVDAMLKLDQVSDKKVQYNSPRVTLDAVSDVVIAGTKNLTTPVEGSLLTVSSGATNQMAILEFDVGDLGSQVRAARLDLFAVDNPTNTSAYSQHAYLLVPNDPVHINWNDASSYTEVPLDSLGAVRFTESGLPTDRYYGTDATPNDVARLNQYIRDTGKVVLALKAEEPGEPVPVSNGRREWADIETYRNSEGEACPARLVLNGGDIVLNASVDGWIREVDPDKYYEDDYLSVWKTPLVTDGTYGQRYGLLSFDLSEVEVPITDAALELYSVDNYEHHNHTDYDHQVFAIDVDSIADLTWDNYSSVDETAFETFGHMAISGSAPTGAWYTSDEATGADLTLLESIRTAGEGILNLSIKALLEEVLIANDSTGTRIWAGSDWLHPDDNQTRAPQLLLILDETIPGDANGDGRVDGSDVTILAGNWQVSSGATWEMGDFNGDGKVDGSDVTILAGNWQRGTTTQAASVPEPSTFALFLFGMATLTLLRYRCRRIA